MNPERDALRLPDFDNEIVEIVAFNFGKTGKRSWEFPTMAEFLTGATGAAARATVFLYHPEDHTAFSKAGFDLRGFEGTYNPPISVLIKQDRIASIKSVGGAWVDVQRSLISGDKPGLNIVSLTSAPAVNPDNGPVPQAYPEPVLMPIPTRKSEDGGNGAGPGKARLYAKLAKVMGEVGAVGERGQHGQGYSYATDGDMFNAVRTKMAAANLAMLPPRLLGQRKEGADIYIDLEFIMADGETGETLITPWYAKLQSNNDKAIHAAMTMCVKYFLKYTFLISTEGDEDADKTSGGKGQYKQSQNNYTPRTPTPQSARKPKEATAPAPDAAKSPAQSAGHSQPIPDGESVPDVAEPTDGDNPSPAVVSEMPGDLFQLLMKDKDITTAGPVGQERAATIRKLWAEGKITADMDAFDRALVVIDRLQSHKKGGAK